MGSAYYLSGGKLSALDLASSTTQWSFAGDLALNTPPLVIDGVVVEGSSAGTVFLVDRTSGQLLWSGQAARALEGFNESQNAPLPAWALATAT